MDHKHYVTRPVLDESNCLRIIKEVTGMEATDFLVDPDSNGLGVHQQYVDLPEDDTWSALYESLWRAIERVNDMTWGFVINDYHQPLRVARYLPGYSHDWHLDYTNDDASKIAVSVPLNDGFVGGTFRMLETEPITLSKGMGVFFPAFHGHKVDPITEGERWVLLAWVTGPRFV